MKIKTHEKEKTFLETDGREKFEKCDLCDREFRWEEVYNSVVIYTEYRNKRNDSICIPHGTNALCICDSCQQSIDYEEDNQTPSHKNIRLTLADYLRNIFKYKREKLILDAKC